MHQRIMGLFTLGSLLYLEVPFAHPQNISPTPKDLYYQKIEPLVGLKYRILRKDPSVRFLPVKPDSVFHTNDHIRLELEANAPGFLYVLQQGSDSTWSVLFPSAEIRDNNNRVGAFQPVNIPRIDDFFFDEQPGREHVFVVLSRKQEYDLEQLLATIRSGSGKAEAAERTDPARTDAYKSISAKMTGDLLSRNLKVSRVDDPLAQNAMFVVNAVKSEDRLVSEIVLTHAR